MRLTFELLAFFWLDAREEVVDYSLAEAAVGALSQPIRKKFVVRKFQILEKKTAGWSIKLDRKFDMRIKMEVFKVIESDFAIVFVISCFVVPLGAYDVSDFQNGVQICYGYQDNIPTSSCKIWVHKNFCRWTFYVAFRSSSQLRFPKPSLKMMWFRLWNPNLVEILLLRLS